MDAKEKKVGQGQDLNFECAECQRIKIKYGAINSMVSFELETLSQHRHLIGKLQDEVYAQRSQIEDLHYRLEQCEKNQRQPSTPTNNGNASRNVSEASVGPIPDLNEPVEAEWVQKKFQDVKQEPSS
jgi:hypothetical protein